MQSQVPNGKPSELNGLLSRGANCARSAAAPKAPKAPAGAWGPRRTAETSATERAEPQAAAQALQVRQVPARVPAIRQARPPGTARWDPGRGCVRGRRRPLRRPTVPAAFRAGLPGGDADALHGGTWSTDAPPRLLRRFAPAGPTPTADSCPPYQPLQPHSQKLAVDRTTRPGRDEAAHNGKPWTQIHQKPFLGRNRLQDGDSREDLLQDAAANSNIFSRRYAAVPPVFLKRTA